MSGPLPLYRPVFTADQLAQAQQVACQHQAAHAHVQRAQLALLLHVHPWLDNASLARQLGQHPNWVRRWRKRWAKYSFSLEDKKGRGRRAFFSPTGKNHRQSRGL